MIGTIRKHSKWLWWFIAAATVISFIWWGASVPSRNGAAGMASGNYGSIYGKKITEQDYADARHEFDLFYWFHNGYEWPERNSSVTSKEIDTQVYIRIMLLRKAQALGIYVDDKSAAAVAGELLSGPDLVRAFHLHTRSVPVDAFVKNILQPAGLTADDFERFARHDLALQQVVQLMGLAGDLFTPQQAEGAWEREHQERNAQIVFFSATNFLAQSIVTPAAVAQFYTNYLAEYRLPDRVQVSYVEFNLSNYLSAAEQKIGKTNLDYQVNSIFAQNGMDAVPDAKTPDEAKVKIREYVIRQQAMKLADADANDFANSVFAQTPPRPENLAAVAKEKNYAVKTTAPFAAQYGPSEFIAPESFIKSAFALTPDDPFAGPVLGTYSYYVMALGQQLPSEIPSLEKIHDRVAQDFQMQQAAALAQRAGTNFISSLQMQSAAGKNFAAACVAAGFQPETLPPFSLSTEKLPELADRAGLPQVKQAVFGTPIGHASGFEATDDGGFVVFVQSQLPVDTSEMKSDLPQYLAQIRRERAYEVFQSWVQLEANHQLANTPVFAEQTAVKK